MARSPTRFIGLDIHKEYFVAVGVNAEREVIFGPQRASNYQLDEWIQRYLTGEDAVVLRSDCDFQSEMTANAYLFYDSLLPHVHSVIVVHPANVALVTKAQVKTDKKAALALAQLHAVGLLTGVWIPPHKIRDLRSLIAQREKMVRLSTMAKNRLHAMLHRKHLVIEGKLFAPEHRVCWESLPLSETEQFLVHSDLETLDFAQRQIEQVEACLKQESARDDRIPWLVQLLGVAMLTASRSWLQSATFLGSRPPKSW